MIEHKPTGPIDRINYAFSRVTMWGPAFIVGIIFYEVIMRYLFFKPTLWVNEMSLWAGGFVFIPSGLYAMQQRSHIRIFVLYDMAPLWARRFFDVLSAVCVAIFAFAVIWGGFGEAAAKFGRWEAFGTAWDPPIPATNKPMVLVTVLVLTLQCFSNLVRDWPANRRVRQVFDIAVAVIIIGLCLWAIPSLIPNDESAMKVPDRWRLFIGLLLLSAILLSLIGLIRDFNTAPEPIEENDDPLDEFNLPDDLRPDAVNPNDNASLANVNGQSPDQRS